MALTYIDWDGSTPSIEVPIPCLNKSHMFAYTITLKGDGTVDVGNVALIPNEVTYDAVTGFCTFHWNTAPNRSIRFLRSTPYTHVLHDFGNGTVFNLNMYLEQQKQMLYLWQESVETKNLISILGEGSDYSVVESLWKTKYERDVQAAFEAGKSYVDTYTLSALSSLSGGTTNPASTLLGVYGTSRVPVPDFNSAYVNNRALEQALFGYMQDIQTAPVSTNITVGDLNMSISSGKVEAQSALLTRAKALLGDKFSGATVRGTTVTSSVASTLLERMLYGYAYVGTNPETVRTVAQNWQGASGTTNPTPPPKPDPDPTNPYVLKVASSEFPELDERETSMISPMVDSSIIRLSTATADYTFDTFLKLYEKEQPPSTWQWYSGSLLLTYLSWLDTASPSYMEASKVQSYAKKKLDAAGVTFTGSYADDMKNVQEPRKELLSTWYLLAKWQRGRTQELYDEFNVWYPPLQPTIM